MKIEFDRKALVAYLTAGMPDMDFTAKAILKLQEAGAAAIELGVPYSDPVSDGPVIAEASLLSLAGGTNLDGIFEMVGKIKKKLTIPVYLMSYYAPIYAYGADRLMVQSRENGVTGLVLPDITIEEGGTLCDAIKSEGLDPVMLVYPNTPEERVKAIADKCGSFVYYVNLFGTTGVRKELPETSLEHLRLVRQWAGKPVCAGFGISGKEMFDRLTRVCDGGIIGSALMRIVLDNRGDKKAALEGIDKFVRTVLGQEQ